MAVDDPVVAVSFGKSLLIGQVRTCTWLTESLAPDFFSGKQLG